MPAPVERARILVRGAVQGVGFRPFVHRLATELGLCGWAQNSSQGLVIEAEGASDVLGQFLSRLERECPPRAEIREIRHETIAPAGDAAFEIRASDASGAKTAAILPDIAPCPDCLRELFDPANRRHRYPFINCTNCGPRFSIIESLPYDRPATSMKAFALCPDCAREYHDPADRRFHAQPNACPVCGPRLALWDGKGGTLAEGDDALRRAADAIRAGAVLALKGVGGFQLIVDARNEGALALLRRRKCREEKPFAVMMSAIEEVRRECRVSPMEEALLLSPEAPIVLLHRIDAGAIPAAIAPGNPLLGVMLPSSPLHHLLLEELRFPIVATSGNLTDEPICIDEHEAIERLRGIADVFLVHNRSIVRHMDDSIVRVVAGREMILRRARGYAPRPVHLPGQLPPILGVGAHLKNAVALSVGQEVFVSQHIGDLETAQAHAAFRRSAADLPRLYETAPAVIAHDLHPDYVSTRFATDAEGRKIAVQHHWAHVVSCLADNGIDGPALGVAWDGTGYGTDGTIWGGEFLRAKGNSFERVAHLRTFRLPGGDVAAREPRRSALGLLFECGLLDHPALAPLREFSPGNLTLLRRMLERGFQTPVTSSMGRLFDAVAALIGVRQIASFEGQAAMELEFLADPEIWEEYPFALRGGEPCVLDWEPMIEAMLEDLRNAAAPGVISAKFHNTLAAMVVVVARHAGEPRVALTGGCFQNGFLLERVMRGLREAGFEPLWHRNVPPNDGGIALGQILAAVRQL
ncbi:MAG TPA: carbamoyltransferase HypF [Chthoniobacterales bacterium]